MRTLYSHSWLRLPAAGMVAIAIFAAGIIGVMSWSRTQPQAAAAASIAQPGEPVQLAQAQTVAPKQSAPKQTPPVQAPKPRADRS
jgi:hypothetical protein